MHMFWTALIGQLILLVTNVRTHDPLDASFVNSNLYTQEGNAPDIFNEESPFWWMNKGSPFKRSFSQASADSAIQSVRMDLSNNPFLNGNSIQPQQHQQHHENAFAASNVKPQRQRLDMTNNPFLSGRPFASLSADTEYSASSINDFSAGSYVAPGYLPPEPAPTVRTPIKCQGNGKVCVEQRLCRNGYVDSSLVDNSNQICQENEICCTIQVAPGPSPSPPTVRPVVTQRPTPPPTYQPSPQAIPCKDRNSVCILPNQCANGVTYRLPNGIESTTHSQRCYAPEVCCRYEEPPQPTAAPTVTQQYYQTTTKPPPPVTTRRPVVTERPYVPPVTTQRPYVPPQTQRPIVTQKPYVPPQTQRPYVPPQTQRPYVPPQTQRPIVIQTTKAPFKGEEYIPPKDNHIGEPSNTNIYTKIPPKPERGEDQKSEPIQRPASSNENPRVVRPGEAPPPLPPIQCPAATNCTEIQFCTSDGVISKIPVILSKEQEVYRVPLSDCRNIVKGYTGKCCRDPDYVDPWPVSILGQYNATILGFDDGSYNPERVKNNRPVPAAPIRGQGQLSLPIAVTAQSQNSYTRTPFPQQPINQLFQRDKVTPYPNEPIASGSEICAVRDKNSLPKGLAPYDAAFGEFPWQAMILKESTKTLLCGGAIINANTVITAAHCIDGQKPIDILIKGGEWKLGSDEEPKPFQTIRVRGISFHPEYQSAIFGRDIALLHLENNLKFDKHIGPICIDEDDFEPNPIADICVTTGWGKEVLKYHAADALMHITPISPLAQSECEAALGPKGFSPSGAICGRPSIDSCEVDVGSALACQMGNGKYLLKGIYSKENGCNSPNPVITFAKVDAKWIKNPTQSPVSIPKSQPPQTSQTRPTYVAQSNTPQVTYSLPSTRAPAYLPPIN